MNNKRTNMLQTKHNMKRSYSMRYFSPLLLISILFLPFVSPAAEPQRMCRLEGIVHDRPETREVLVLPANRDLLVSDYVVLPVEAGKFHGEIPIPVQPEVYQLVFREEIDEGDPKPVYFIPDKGTLRFQLYPSERHTENQVSGKGENKKLQALVAQRNRIFSSYDHITAGLYGKKLSPTYYTARFIELDSLLRNTFSEGGSLSGDLITEYNRMIQDSSCMTSSGLDAIREIDSLYEQSQKALYAYIERNPSIGAYYLVRTDFNTTRPLLRTLAATAYTELFRKRYAEHPYTSDIETMISARGVVPGSHVPDFTAPDIYGRIHRLSEEINGKVALINLWASWCAPSRSNGSAAIPLYYRFKNRGFTVVSVARERDDLSFARAQEEDRYPWLCLIDLKGENRIWERYGAPLDGGMQVLVDEKGTILAINPTIRELLDLLNKKLPPNIPKR